MEEKISQRIRITKQLLKSSLMELLETESIHKIVIKNLCDHAEINRSTFYKYYGSQYDLLREIEQDTVQNIISILESHPNANGKVDALLEITRYLDQNIQFMRPLIINDPEFVNMIFSHPTIQREINATLEPYYNAEQREYVFGFIASGCARITQIWLNKKDRESAERIAELLAKLMCL